MDKKLRILVANEPRSYRETIARVFEVVKPRARVTIAEPEALKAEAERFAPHLVICSRITAAVEDKALAWVELYPGHGPSSRVGIGGEWSTVAGMELADLLSIVERVERLAEAR